MKKRFSLIIVMLLSTFLFTQCIKEPVENTTITGQITNSQTGNGLANATLSFCEPFTHGANSSTVNPRVVFTVTTNATGQYNTTTAVVGTYTLMVQATGFFTVYYDNFVVSSGVLTTIPPITIVQTLANSVFRIVLTWGVNPSDLDSHLTGPTASSNTRFHIYYSNDTYNPSNAVPIVILDVDDTNSYGPETTTINTFQNGLYRFSVHNYSDQSTNGGSEIKSSPAKVDVYGTTGLIKTYTAPTFITGGGNTWIVFEMTVANGVYTIVDKNTYITSSSASGVTKK